MQIDQPLEQKPLKTGLTWLNPAEEFKISSTLYGPDASQPEQKLINTNRPVILLCQLCLEHNITKRIQYRIKDKITSDNGITRIAFPSKVTADLSLHRRDN